VSLVVDSGLARADRQCAILKGWRDAIHSGRYLGSATCAPANRLPPQAMLLGEDKPFTPGELNRYADAGVRTSLAAHHKR
jgi:hypothetical protein